MTSTKPVTKWCARNRDGVRWRWTIACQKRDVRRKAEAFWNAPWTKLRRRYGLTIVRVEIREIG